jgi:hypothetical protein
MSKSAGRAKVKATARATPRRAKLTADESLKRMSNFAKRKENFATVRKGKDRSLSA